MKAGWIARQGPEFAAALLHYGRIVRLQRGTWVHGEGDEDTGLYAVLDGALRMAATVGATREVLIDMAGPGAVFGQSRRFGGGPRLVSASAARPSTVLVVSDQALARVAGEFPDLWRQVAELLYGQLGATVRLAAEALSLPPAARIAARVVTLDERWSGEGGLPVTQADLAEMTGLSRKTVSGHVLEMQRRGLVELAYGRLVIRDRVALRRMISVA